MRFIRLFVASVLTIWACMTNVVLAQNRMLKPSPRTAADITTTSSFCGTITQSAQKAPNSVNNIFYSGDTISIDYRIQTPTTGASINIGFLQYSSLGTTTTLPDVASNTPLKTVSAATTTTATVTDIALPNVVCRNVGDCALTWQYVGTTTYYTCSDVYVYSRANDAIITFYVNRGSAAVPLAASLQPKFKNYFNPKYQSYNDYNVRGPATDPVADGGGNFAVTFVLSDGPGWVNAQNMSYQVQNEFNTRRTELSAALFGVSSSITSMDVNDAETRAKAPSTTATAVAVIIVFLILVAILLGVWYYYWKYHPQKLRACVERTCPCFDRNGSDSSSTSRSINTSGGARVPSSPPPARPQLTI